MRALLENDFWVAFSSMFEALQRSMLFMDSKAFGHIRLEMRCALISEDAELWRLRWLPKWSSP